MSNRRSTWLGPSVGPPPKLPPPPPGPEYSSEIDDLKARLKQLEDAAKDVIILSQDLRIKALDTALVRDPNPIATWHSKIEELRQLVYEE